MKISNTNQTDGECYTKFMYWILHRKIPESLCLKYNTELDSKEEEITGGGLRQNKTVSDLTKKRRRLVYYSAAMKEKRDSAYGPDYRRWNDGKHRFTGKSSS